MSSKEAFIYLKIGIHKESRVLSPQEKEAKDGLETKTPRNVAVPSDTPARTVLSGGDIDYPVSLANKLFIFKGNKPLCVQ